MLKPSGIMPVIATLAGVGTSITPWSSGVPIYIVGEAAAIFSKSCDINIDRVSFCEAGAEVILLFESR
jgi:hypothetical protein